MKRIDDINVCGKRILLRVDLNSPMEGGKVTPNPRIVAHSATIKGLAKKGAKVIVLAHQGRKGKHDFANLQQHALLVQRIIGSEVKFIPDVAGNVAKSAIAGMNDSDIIMLDNVRMLDDEEGGPYSATIVKELSPLADCFVLDAFSVAHRAQASVVGFTKSLPSYAGPVLVREVEAAERIRGADRVTFFFGGSKVDDSIAIAKQWLGKGHVERILLGGVDAVLFLYAKGHNVAASYEFLKKNGLLEFEQDARNLLSKFDEKIVLPVDVGLNIGGRRVERDVNNITEGEIWDIGERTIAEYERILKEAQTIVLNGPAGVYEKEGFGKGTERILLAVAESSAFSLLGGGHTASAVEKFGLDKKRFGYVSLAGKALIEFLAGRELPALAALKNE